MAKIFLKSLDADRKMELWIMELSLTPRFDEKAALALDNERNHLNARAGWERFIGFSFVKPQIDGFYRLHKIMNEALRALIESDEKKSKEIHEWFCNYWKIRKESSLVWYHQWIMNPEESLKEWKSNYENAMKNLQIAKVRELFRLWTDTPLDDNDRKVVGDKVWAETHKSIAYALWDTPLMERGSALSSAIEHCQAALRVYKENEIPLEWATTQNTLGHAYSDLTTGNRRENLQMAIACYKAALSVRAKIGLPQDWARTQNGLGAAYSDLPDGNQMENQLKAIDCFKNALRVYKKSNFTEEWAMMLNNLGDTYVYLDGQKNLKKAIACLKPALKVYKEKKLFQDWAMTLNNLGEAYYKMSIEKGGENLQKAIECHLDALTIYNFDDFPIHWAKTQRHLGNAYAQNGEFEKAIYSYEKALRVFTEKNFSQDWAKTQFSIGSTLVIFAQKTKNIDTLSLAYSAFSKAIQGFRCVGMIDKLKEAEERISEIDKLMSLKNI